MHNIPENKFIRKIDVCVALDLSPEDNDQKPLRPKSFVLRIRNYFTNLR